MANLDEFNLQLSGELDQQKSKTNVDSDIAKLEKAIEHLKLQAEIDPKSVQNIAKQLSDILNQKVVVDNIQIDSGKITKTAQQVGQKIGDTVEKSVQQSLSIDDVIDKQVTDLMAKYSIAGKKGSKAFDEIRQAVINYRKELATVSDFDPDDEFSFFSNSADIRKVTSALTDHMKVADATKDTYASLVEYIKAVNNSGTKIHLPESIRQEYGDDFSSMRSQLGKAFTTGKGGDFESFITELNGQLGNVIDMSQGAEAAFGDLVQKVNSAKGGNFLSGDELFKQGYLDRNEIERDITSAIDIIEEEEKKLAQVSTTTANTVVQNEQKKKQAYQQTANVQKTLTSEESVIKSGVGVRTFDSVKEAQEYFKGLLRDEQAVIATTERFGQNNNLTSFTINIKRATGEVESLRYAVDALKDDEGNIEQIFYKLSGSTTGDSGAIKQIKDIENAFSDYTAKLSQFKSTNSEILSGLTTPLSDFETKLAGLKNGTSTIDEVTNAYKSLNAEASNITKNFSRQLSPIDSAIRNLAKGEETISGLRAEFKGLNNAPKEINTELNKCARLLENVKKIESQEGRTENWSQAYRQWSDSVDTLQAKLKTLRKEQSNVASTQIFNTSDLKNNNIAYMSKVYNTIEKQMVEINRLAKAKDWQIVDVSGVEQADGKIKKLTLTVRDAEGALKKLDMQREKLQGNGKAQYGLMQVGDIKVLETASQAQEKLAQSTEKANAKLASQANKIQLSSDVTKLTTDYQKFGVVSQEVENNLKELKLAQEAVINAKGTDRLATEIERYNTKLAETKSSLKELTTTQVSLNQRTSQMKSMQEWMRKNKNATKLVGDQVKQLIEECKTCDAVRFNGIKREFDDLVVTAGKAGKLGNSFFGGLIDQGKKFVQWIGVTGTVMRGIQIGKDMIRDVKDLDDSLLELSKVSDLSASGLEKVTNQAYELGEKVARTGREVIDATTEFKRAGFDMQQSMDMAESAMVMTNVAENITDTADAAGTLISVLKGFNMDASETMTIVDKINQVSNTSPIGFDNIAEGLERTAGTMAQSGNTIDQTIGLITAGFAQLRNVEKVSTGLITLSARLRGVDEEGETIDGLSAKLQEDFGKIGVAIENADGSLRSIYEIAQDYAKVLPNLSDKQKQYYAELAAGKRQVTVWNAITQQFQDAEYAVNQSLNSQNSALDENQKKLDSIGGHVKSFESAMEHLSSTVVESDLIKFFVDLGTTGVKAIDGIVNALTPLGTIGLGAGLFASFKNAGIFKTIFSDINKVAIAMESLKNITQFNTGSTIANGKALSNVAVEQYKASIDGLSLSQAQAALSATALNDAQKQQILTSAGLLESTQAVTLEEVKQMASSATLSAQKKEEILATLQGAYSEGQWNTERLEAIASGEGEAATIAQTILAKKAESAENVKNIAGRKALTASLKEELAARIALMASNPVTWIVGIAAVSAVLIALQEKFSKSLEECTEDLKNYNSEFENAQSSVKSLESELDTCQTRLAELQKLEDNGTLSIVEQEEYERLQKTNDELERNLKIEREKAQLNAIDGAKTADETVNKTVQSNYVRGDVDSYEGVVLHDQLLNVTPKEELEGAIAEYNRLQGEIDKLNKSYDNGSISFEDYTTQLNSLTDAQTKARTRASEMSDILIECEQSYNNLENTGGKFTTTSQQNYDSVKLANQEYSNFLDTINGVNASFDKLDTGEKAQTLKNKYAQKTLQLENGQGSYTVEDKEISDWIDTLSDEDLTVLASINFSGEQTKDSMQEALDYVKTHTDATVDETDILSFSDVWNSEDFENARKELLALAEAGQLTPEAFESTEKYKTLLEQTGLSAEEAAKKINSMTDASTQLQSMSSQISKMSDMLADKKAGTVASASDLAGFDAEVRGLDSWEEFERVMGSSKSSMEQCQKAANALATEWVNSNNFLAQLTESNKDYYTTQLKNMGVENASAVVKNALALKEQQLALETEYSTAATEHNTDAKNTNAQVSDDLSNATINEVLQLAKEKGWSDSVTQSLVALIAQKRGVNASTLNFNGDISNLLAYVKAIGGACSALQTLNNMKSGKDMGVTSLVQSQMIEKSAQTEFTSAVKKYEEQISAQIGNVKVNPVGSSGYKGSGSKSKSNSDSKDKTNETKQTIDWIDRLLTVLQNKIDATKAKFENLFSLKDKSNNLAKQIQYTKALLNATNKSVDRYLRAANKVGLSKSIQKKVQNGSYDISEYSSKTADKIQKYENYYDKYKELKQQADELETDIRTLRTNRYQLYVDDAEAKIAKSQAYAELASGNYKEQNKHLEYQKKQLKTSYDYQIKIAKLNKDSVEVSKLKAEYQKEINDLTKQEFDNISNIYDKKLEQLNNSADYLNTKISGIESKGYVVSETMYKSLANNEKKQLSGLEDELDKLRQKRDEAVADGTVKKGTNAWYEMQNKIWGVKNAIEESKNALIEYDNQMRQLKWDAFDRQEDFISQIQDESNFLIDLMNNKDLYDDNGNWTDYANATVGLRAVNYNAYMAQADDYEKEIKSLQEQINNDPYNLDLIERKKELISTQRDLIKSAESEKDAIQSLVKDGYDKWLDALQKSIDLRRDELDAVSSLYEYEKKISELTKNASALEKQQLALQGDNSEETRAELQQINEKLKEVRNDLAESEYEQWKTDQQKMLDNLYDDAESWLNSRLDDIDGLISDVIDSTNSNASTIKSTLEKVTSDVGTSLSSDMNKIWTVTDGVSSIVSSYGTDFSTKFTTINSTLGEIRDYVAKISNNPNNGGGSNGGTVPENPPKTSGSTNKTATPGQVLDTAEKVINSVVPGFGVGENVTNTVKLALVKSFIDKNKHKATHKKEDYASLNQYIYDKTNGYVLSKENEMKLADILGVKISSDLTGYEGAKDLKKICDALKKIGFTKGGTIGNAIKQSGEDGFILARTGEEVLSLEKIKELGKSFQMINPVLNNVKTMIPDSQIVQRQNFGGNNIDKVQMEINLPNVTNYEEFKRELIKDRQFEKVVQNMTFGNALGKNSLSKYRI